MKLKDTRYPGISSAKIGALYGYLNSLGGGRDATPAADFYPHLAREEVAQLSLQMTDSALSSKPLLKAYEWTRLPKFGAQGGLPSYRDALFQETIDRYWREERPCQPECDALSELLRWFSTAELEPYSYAEVISRQRRNGPLKTSSGLPFLTEREKVIHDAIQLARSNKHYPAILGMRAIRQGLRDIFMYDMGTNLQELSFVYAVMDWLIANTNAVAAWLGKQNVEAQMQQQFPSEEAVTHLSTDYSKMDTTVQEPQVKLGI